MHLHLLLSLYRLALDALKRVSTTTDSKNKAQRVPGKLVRCLQHPQALRLHRVVAARCTRPCSTQFMELGIQEMPSKELTAEPTKVQRFDKGL